MQPSFNMFATNSESYQFGNSFSVVYDDIRTMNLFGQNTTMSDKFEENDWIDRWRIMNDVLYPSVVSCVSRNNQKMI